MTLVAVNVNSSNVPEVTDITEGSQFIVLHEADGVKKIRPENLPGGAADFAELTGNPMDSEPLALLFNAKENASNKGAANGYAPLGSDSKVPAGYLPSYVDDVLEYANYAALPVTGETGKIYVTIDTNYQYRWSGSAYIQLVASPGTTDSLTEGSTNLYFTAARVLATVISGFSATVGAITSSDTILSAINKIVGTYRLKPVDEAMATTGTITLDFNTETFDNITQTGSITLTGTSTALYSEKTYVIKGSRNIVHTFTIDATWRAANNTLPSSMYDNIIRIYSVNSEVFYTVNLFDETSGSFEFSEGFVLYPETTKVRIYLSATLDQAVIPSTSWFTFSSGRTVTAVSLSYSYIELTCGSSFAIGDTDTINYTGGGGRLQDLFGNLLANFSESVSINILVRDQFNRANNALTLGNADTGQTWQYVSPAVFGISSNRMYCASAVDTGAAVNHNTFIDAAQNNHSVTVDKIYPISAQYSQLRVMVRRTDSNNFYSALFTRVGGSSTITCIITSMKSGVGVVLATLSGISTTSPASEITKTYSVKISGTTISVYEGTTFLGAYTDNASDRLLTGSNIGIQVTSSATSSGALDRIDNLLVSKI